MNATINDVGNTALIEVICVYGNTDVASLLLRQPEIDVNAMNNEGVTALMCASSQGHTEIVRMLLEKGAKVNATNDDGGETALMIASANGRADVVSLLLENGANLNATNDYGETALVIASENGRADVLSLLLERREENIKKANLVTKKGTTKDGRPLVPHSQKDIASHFISFAGGKRKTRKSTKPKKNKKTRSKKPQFLYNPNDPKKSFDVYIDKNPDDTITIKYTTVDDVKNTIQKLEKLYKNNKYSHKRIWQVGMIMKVRLEAMLKNKHLYPNAKNVKSRYELSKKYFKFLGKRTQEKDDNKRKKMTFKS